VCGRLRLRRLSEGSQVTFCYKGSTYLLTCPSSRTRERLKEAAEAEVAAAVGCEVRANGSARDAACLPFGVVGELRRKLGPIALAVLLLFMGVGMMLPPPVNKDYRMAHKNAQAATTKAHNRL